METLDPMNAVIGGLAIAILIGGFLMMFTNLFTSRD